MNLRILIPLITLMAPAPGGWAADDVPFTQTRTDGPQTLLIAYRCNPDQRVALRQSMLAGGVARFQTWKDRGVLKDYRILFNDYIDSETYDMLSLLTFADFAGVAKWREIEKTSPGGLTPDVLKRITSAVTYPLDAARGGASDVPPIRGKSIYFIIPYDFLIPTDEYVHYLDTYVVPQVEGWLKESVLADYTIYIGRYATGRPWSSLFVLE